MNNMQQVNFRISKDEYNIIKKIKKNTAWNESQCIRFCINIADIVLSSKNNLDDIVNAIEKTE